MNKSFSVLLITILSLTLSGLSYSQNVNVSPTPATYPTLSAAFTAINAGTHGAGAVTVSIVGDVTEAATASLNGGVFTSCSITPSGARTVTGNFNASVISLAGADNVTIDGLNSAGNSLTIVNPNAGTNANGIQCINGALNNIIRKVTAVGLGASGATAGGRGFNIGQSIAGTSGNNDNLIDGCTTNGFRRGIQDFGTAGLFINERTIIRNCKIKNFTSLGVFYGSETRDGLIEGNELFYDAAVANDPGTGGARVIGIQGCGDITVRNNRIHDITGTVAGGFIGIISIPIIFTAPISTPVTTVSVYNNMIALNNCITSATFIYGIYMTSNASTTNYTSNTYYNSVRIGGSSGATAAAVSECIVIAQDGAHGAETSRYYNNISLNDRTDGDATSIHLGSELVSAAGVTLEADHNVAYSSDTTVRGWDAAFNGTIYRGLGGMELYKDTLCALDIEQNTIFMPVSFVSTTDLHLVAADIYSNLDAKNTALVSTDYDGQSRAITGTNLFSYRGADDILSGKRCYLVYFKFQELICFPNRVIICLRESTAPYALYDCYFGKVREWVIITSVACVRLYFGPAVSSNYYLEVMTKHSIRTQSANPVNFAASTGTYDFTTSAGQAYGGNQSGSSAPFEMFNGDVNQDDIIEGADGSDWDNDAANFASGCYLRTDVNDDGVVDGGDGLIIANNSDNFVAAVLLPGTESTSPFRNTGRDETSVIHNTRRVDFKQIQE